MGQAPTANWAYAIVRPNLLSLPEMLSNWMDGRISCVMSAMTKIGIDIPQGTSKWNASYQMKRSKSPYVKNVCKLASCLFTGSHTCFNMLSCSLRLDELLLAKMFFRSFVAWVCVFCERIRGTYTQEHNVCV